MTPATKKRVHPADQDPYQNRDRNGIKRDLSRESRACLRRVLARALVLSVGLGMGYGVPGWGDGGRVYTHSVSTTPTSKPTGCTPAPDGFCTFNNETYFVDGDEAYQVISNEGTAGSAPTGGTGINRVAIDTSDVTSLIEGKKKAEADKKQYAEKAQKDALSDIGSSADPDDAVTDSDRCAYSKTVGDELGCKGTEGALKGMAMTSTLLDQAGQAGVQAHGALVQQQAQMEGASQADMMRNTAQLTENTAWKESVSSLLNVASGFMAFSKAKKHEQNAADFKAARTTSGQDSMIEGGGDADLAVKGSTNGGLAGRIADKFGLKKSVDAEMQAAQKIDGVNEVDIKKRAASVLGAKGGKAALNAQSEQLSMAEDANTAGTQMMVQGLVKAASAGANFLAAKGMREAADQLAAVPTPGMVIDPGAIEMPGFVPTTAVPGTSAAISGSGVNPESAAAEEAAGEVDSGDLGRGFDPNARDRSKLTQAPPAGKFALAGGGPSGGGGPGFGGGGSTAAASGGGDDGAGGSDDSVSSDPSRYVGGGSGGGYGGFGGGRGGGDGKETDLSGLLSQFLPKEDKDLGPKNGILDFGGNGREIATDPDASLLGRDADIFKRVSDTYRGKSQQGQVGI